MQGRAEWCGLISFRRATQLRNGGTMRHLKDLIAGYAQPGRLEWIGLRPARRADMLCVDAARITDKGLEGDHAGAMRRAVTLIQAEHLPVIGAMLGRDAVAADALRRNLVV